MKTQKQKPKGHCAWCLRKMDRVGICLDCAKLIQRAVKQREREQRRFKLI